MANVIKTLAVIQNVKKHSESVVSYEMVPEKTGFRFRPGQYLHLALDEYDPSRPWPESRVFSIANSPTRINLIKIAVSIKGSFTRRMYDRLKKSDQVWIKLPYGSFSFDSFSSEIVLVAGGTGITPFISFIEYAVDKNFSSTIKLFYGFRHPGLCIFDDIIQESEKRLSSFKKYYFIEEPGNWKCIKGKLDIDTIMRLTGDINTAQFYFSGPPEMVFTFKDTLHKAGVSLNHIHIDDWE
jgi:ferredoxin-NADP reductase